MSNDIGSKARLQFEKEERSESGIHESSVKDKGESTHLDDSHPRSRLRLTAEELAEPKLEKPLRKVDKATERLDKAKARMPKHRAITIARETDIATGKAKFQLAFEEKAIQPSKLIHHAIPAPLGEIHRQIGENEDENVGLKSVHSMEKGAESAVRFTDHSIRAGKLNRYRAMDRAERQLDKANVRVLQKKEQLSSNPFSRWQQKRAIQQSYKTSKAAGTLSDAAQKGASTVKGGVKKAFGKNKKTYALGGILFLMLAMVMNGLSACTPIVQGVLQSVVIATYPAEDADILAAERFYRDMEKKLEDEMNNYASYHPGYDEYQSDLDEIWHDPHVLISLISARMNGEWTIDNVYGYMNTLFEKQYIVTQTITSETRYRKEWVTHHEKVVDPETSEVTWRPYQMLEDVPYRYRICHVNLKNFDLSHLPFHVLSREGVGRYAMYISVHGNREDLFWGNSHVSPLRDYTNHDIPEEYLEDETFVRLIEEAEQYLGFPYVWGGDSPETSFDCSGFVSYVFTNSGVRNVGRLGATSLYGACQKITPDQAKPGDLIFFEGTIPGDTGISHVGIYVGDGWMIHCGKPVGYQRIDDSYYTKHFFGYGRLIR